MVDMYVLMALSISAALPAVGIILGKKFSGKESDEYLARVREESRELENKIVEVLGADASLASKNQLASLRKKIENYRAALESQRASREALEKQLGTAHDDIIARETAHQEIKSVKQEDEETLQTVVNNYNDISSESVSLERRLADSLKTIDKMTAEVALTADQKAVFEALSTALTNASAQLRDVIVAYQNVYERLQAIQSQYTDLENEYIKLVELQLEA